MDDGTVERLLQGALAPENAPLGYGGVATLVHEARAEARSVTSERAEETIAAMVAAIELHAAAAVAAPRPVRRLRSKVAAGAAAGFLAVFGSLTAAGALPSAAQNGMATVLGTVGIDVPRGDGGDEGVKPSKSNGDEKDKQGNGNDGAGEDKTNHGECVSAVAGSSGEVVSEVARSDCGKDPKPADPGNGNGPPGGEPPGQSEDEDKTQPTHPPQSNSGGSSGSNNAGGNSNGNGGSGKPDR